MLCQRPPIQSVWRLAVGQTLGYKGDNNSTSPKIMCSDNIASIANPGQVECRCRAVPTTPKAKTSGSLPATTEA